MKSGKSILIVAIGVALMVVSQPGCQLLTRIPAFKVKSKTELLNQMKTEYRKIKTLTYQEHYFITHTGEKGTETVWEAPPRSLSESREGAQLSSDTIFISRYDSAFLVRRLIEDVTFSLPDEEQDSKEHPIALLSFALRTASRARLKFAGFKKKEGAYSYLLKGQAKEPEDVKELWIDPETFLPVRTVTEGEDMEDEIRRYSDYQINPKIEKSRFSIGLTPKAIKLGKRFAKLNSISDFPGREESIGDYKFDLYCISRLPEGYQLTEAQVTRVEISGSVGDFNYEIPAITFTFKNRITNQKVTLDIELTSGEKVMKANLLDYATGNLTIDSSMDQVMAGLSHWGTPKQTTTAGSATHYWLEKDNVSGALIKTDRNWLYINAGYEESLSEKLFLDFANSLVKL